MTVRPILGRKIEPHPPSNLHQPSSKPLLIRAKTGIDPKRIDSQRVRIKFPRRSTTMRIKLNYIAPGLAAAAIGGAIALARRQRRHQSSRAVRHQSPSPIRAGVPRIEPRRSRHHERPTGPAVLIHNVRKAFEYGGLPAQTPSEASLGPPRWGRVGWIVAVGCWLRR